MAEAAVLDLLESRVQFMDNGCWEWTGTRLPKGYGCITRQGRTQYAHRLMYEAVVEPIPDGYDIDHLCKNPPCINPDHLEPVTRRENLMRSTSVAAVNADKTHCLNGHEYTEENTYLRKDRPGRMCQTCQREKYQRRVNADG